VTRWTRIRLTWLCIKSYCFFLCGASSRGCLIFNFTIAVKNWKSLTLTLQALKNFSGLFYSQPWDQESTPWKSYFLGLAIYSFIKQIMQWYPRQICVFHSSKKDNTWPKGVQNETRLLYNNFYWRFKELLLLHKPPLRNNFMNILNFMALIKRILSTVNSMYIIIAIKLLLCLHCLHFHG
jgi:hypothetical protein